jgi:hypothetical protein
MSEKTVQKLPIVITLTLPESSSDSHDGTLLVQRGDLARVYQFAYKRIADLTEVIADALIAFAAVEADPPMIADAPSSAPLPAEPTVAVPLKKGAKAVKVSHLQLTGGETDAAAYKQAVLIAGKLIDGGL